MATKKKTEKTEKIKTLRTFGYVLTNGETGEIRATNVEEAKEFLRQIASSFGIMGKKCFYDFFEVTD